MCVSPKTVGFDCTKTDKIFSGNKRSITDNIKGSARTMPRAYTTQPTAANARVPLGAGAFEGQVKEELIAITDLRKKCMAWAKDRVKQVQFEEAFEVQ